MIMRSPPMNASRMLWKVLVAAGVVFVLSACDRGPLEKAGKAGDKISDIAKESD